MTSRKKKQSKKQMETDIKIKDDRIMFVSTREDVLMHFHHNQEERYRSRVWFCAFHSLYSHLFPLKSEICLMILKVQFSLDQMTSCTHISDLYFADHIVAVLHQTSAKVTMWACSLFIWFKGLMLCGKEMFYVCHVFECFFEWSNDKTEDDSGV